MYRTTTINEIAEVLARTNASGGLDQVGSAELPALLKRLESEWPTLALIVESRIHAGPDAILVVHDNEDVLLCDAEGARVLRSWRVDPDTVEAIRPLAQACRGRDEADHSARARTTGPADAGGQRPRAFGRG